MSTHQAYGKIAEAHWREHYPRMVRELETKGILQEALQEAQDRTIDEMERLIRVGLKQGLTPQQARDQAWEMVRERYIVLPPQAE